MSVSMDMCINCTDLKKMMDECSEEGSTVTLIDVRAPWEYELCHIPGSLHMPLAHLSEHLDSIPRDRPIVTICHHGVRSLQGMRILLEAGFQDVKSLKGGIDAWSNQIDSSLQKY